MHQSSLDEMRRILDRCLPDGMRFLLETAGLCVLSTWLNENDCWGIGRKPAW